MKLTHLLILSAFGCVTIGSAQAGPIIKMLEEKKAKQAASSSSASTTPTTPTTPPAAAAASSKGNTQFSTAKMKCKELGNKEGSDKFNSCVMTLME